MSRGLTREQACAANGVWVSNFEDWEKKPEFRWLRARAEAARIHAIQNDMHVAGQRDWKYYQWQLERFFPNQYGPPKTETNLSLQQNNFFCDPSTLEEARRIMDAVTIERSEREGQHSEVEAFQEPRESQPESCPVPLSPKSEYGSDPDQMEAASRLSHNGDEHEQESFDPNDIAAAIAQVAEPDS
jgi:hypothetical protein